MVDKKSFDHVIELGSRAPLGVLVVHDLLANALKFKLLNTDLPPDRRDSILTDIDRVLSAIRSAEPASQLSGEERKQVSRNLDILHQFLAKLESVDK
jgi:hypothetical protein